MPEEKRAVEAAPKGNEPEEKMDLKTCIVTYLHDVIFYLTIFVILLLLVFRIVIVSGTSMNMTLLDGDYLLLLSNVFYQNPEPGDIVVISKDSFDDGAPIVKRIIATGGQIVDIDFAAGIVYVDGEPLQEDYTYTLTNTTGGMSFPLTVEEGCLFVLGDNRNGSRDSRYVEIGLIDEREILGKAIFLFLPGDNGDRNPQPRDFGRIGVIN